MVPNPRYHAFQPLFWSCEHVVWSYIVCRICSKHALTLTLICIPTCIKHLIYHPAAQFSTLVCQTTESTAI